MGYTLNSAQKAPVLDQNGAPVLSADTIGLQGAPLPFIGPCATAQDDGAGHVEILGTAPGTQDFGLRSKSTNASAVHTVTVTAAPFDWTLGAPVAK